MPVTTTQSAHLAELIRRRKAKSLLAYRGAVDLDIDLDTSRGGRTGW